jgi:hypothetical protein
MFTLSFTGLFIVAFVMVFAFPAIALIGNWLANRRNSDIDMDAYDKFIQWDTSYPDDSHEAAEDAWLIKHEKTCSQSQLAYQYDGATAHEIKCCTECFERVYKPAGVKPLNTFQVLTSQAA